MKNHAVWPPHLCPQDFGGNKKVDSHRLCSWCTKLNNYTTAVFFFDCCSRLWRVLAPSCFPQRPPIWCVRPPKKEFHLHKTDNESRNLFKKITLPIIFIPLVDTTQADVQRYFSEQCHASCTPEASRYSAIDWHKHTHTLVKMVCSNRQWPASKQASKRTP